MAVEGKFEAAIAYILLAAVIDAFDVHVARRRSATSKFGAELDSLADLVNFGVAPAPAAALAVLLPFYFSKLLAPGQVVPGLIITINLITVGLLMISRLPTFSSKHVANCFAGSIPLPLTIAGASGGLVLLLAEPWLMLIVGCAAYISTFGPSYFLHKRQMVAELGVELPD
jgi:phosphatidylserine synthase